MNTVNIDDVKEFWNKNPLCAANIPHPLGSRDFFIHFDKMREEIEPLEYSYELHEYTQFKGKKVLDIGCGNGYVLSKYAQEGANVTGIDITETAIDLCKKRFDFMNLNGVFQVENAESLPFEDNTFDCVCSMGVLHHTPNPTKAIEEIYRILKPNGRLIVMFYHKNSFYYRWKLRLLSIMTKKSLSQLVNEFDGPANPKGDIFSSKELKIMFSKFKHKQTFTGFLTPDMVLPKLGKHILPTMLLKYLEKKFGWNLYLKAFK
ncbi:MAG: class I SAM-dependent methyltransferase [Candidatus Sericytochromatia bacterium]